MKKPQKGKGGAWLVTGFFTLLIMGFTLVVWWEQKSGGSCSQQSQSRSPKSSDANKTPSGNALALVDKGASPQKTGQSATDSENYFCRLIAPANLPGDYLAIVGLGGVFVAIFSLTAIRRQNLSIHHQAIQVRKQTHILKRSAEATFLNAQAVINSERPWLVVTWRSDHEVSGLFRFGCRNQGNTPAKVISVSAKASFVDNLNALTIPPDYSSAAVLPDLNLIVHDDSFPIGHGLNPESFVQTSGKKMSLIVDSREFLVYYGNVVYRDTLYTDSSADGLHETRWCFVYQPGREIRKFVRLGHEEYNRYT